MNNTNDLEQIDIKRMIEIVLDRIVSIVVITLVFGLISFKSIPPAVTVSSPLFVPKIFISKL